MHIGNMGLAPKVGAPVITSPPMRTGGNIDNKRIGIGASMYYPVEQVGALLSMGDCHGAQGDGESSGTGIETSLNGKFKVTLHKKDNLPQVLKPVNYPLLENANEWVINGYAYADWLREIPNPQVNVSKTYPYGGVDFNRAMAVVYNETREFVMNAFFPNKTGAEDFAINVMSNVIDFGITQIVDSNIGFHSIIPKWPFNASAWEDEPYYQAKNKCGTSRAEYP
jgi:acetamidase/formamidase